MQGLFQITPITVLMNAGVETLNETKLGFQRSYLCRVAPSVPVVKAAQTRTGNDRLGC